MMSITKNIEERLQVLNPIHLSVINESDQHAGPPDRETHVRVVIASAEFDGKPRVKRHRMVQKPLKELFDQGLHALAIETQTSAEFEEKGGKSYHSPDCAGGSN